MNKSKFLLFFLFTISCLSSAFGQRDPKAEKILNDMSKKYKSYKSFKANFSYVMESAMAGKNETINGEITIKGDKFRLNIGDQEVINNGTTIWTFLKSSQEVNISNYEPDPEDITPNNIYNVYQKGYKFMLLEETPTTQVVDLIPEDKNKKIFKIRITVSKKDNSIKSWKMFEKSGNRYIYNIMKFQPNPAGVDDKYFVFDVAQHKGVEVVDLR